MAAYSGFPEESYDTVFIILDKMDKIGMDGVKEELLAEGYGQDKVEKYLALFAAVTGDIASLKKLKERLGECLDPETASGLVTIIESVERLKTADFQVKFDPTLVRGMSYYTGTIFEIAMDEFGGSVGGGGRYDQMIGKFTGRDVPACGFSIGFERIVMNTSVRTMVRMPVKNCANPIKRPSVNWSASVMIRLTISPWLWVSMYFTGSF